jgi:hypothetical protein
MYFYHILINVFGLLKCLFREFYTYGIFNDVERMQREAIVAWLQMFFPEFVLRDSEITKLHV